MHILSGLPTRAAKDIGALESVQKFACRMATHNWTSSYQELLSLTDWKGGELNSS